MQMPLLNGPESTRHIRRELSKQFPRFLNIPIVAVSADAFSEQLAEGKNSGMNDYLTKPIDLAKLEEILKKYLVASSEH